MSTFGSLNTALSGLNAARAAIEVSGNNLANVGSAGYTRQRAELQAAAPLAQVGKLGSGESIGQGVIVGSIARLADAELDARVRGTVALASQTDVRADALEMLEGFLREPGENGLSSLLNDFWAGWSEVANQPGGEAAAAVVIQGGQSVADRMALMSSEIDNLWLQQHEKLETWVTDVNVSAQGVAELNAQIRSTLAVGGNANALLDQRSQLAEHIAGLSGATVRELPDGTVDVLIDGSPLVTGSTARSLRVSGGQSMDGEPVKVSWSHRPQDAAALDSGRIAGALHLLAPAGPSGSGGPLATAAASLDETARTLATMVNEVHSQGSTTAGMPGSDFFAFDPGNPAGSLRVLATGAGDLATGAPSTGAMDGSNAQKLAALADAAGGPNELWSTMVLGIGTATRSEAQQALSSAVAADSAITARQSASAVSIDEENVALITNQHAYQGAARVLTAVDEMLDTLINRTGLVGR